MLIFFKTYPQKKISCMKDVKQLFEKQAESIYHCTF